MGLAGTVLVALPAMGEGRNSAIGVALILVALLSYGVALNVMGPLQQEHGALPIIWRAQGLAILLTAPLGLPELVAARWAPGPLLAILALGALGTGVAYAVIATASGRLGATRASATTFLIPPVALLLGVWLRDEQVALVSVVGGAVCVGGAWLMRRASAGRVPAGTSLAPSRAPTHEAPEGRALGIVLLDRHLNRGRAGRERPPVRGVHVRDVDVHVRRHRRPIAAAIGDHHDAVVQPHLGVHQLAVRRGEPTQLDGIEGPNQKVDRFSGARNDEIGRNGTVALRLVRWNGHWEAPGSSRWT